MAGTVQSDWAVTFQRLLRHWKVQRRVMGCCVVSITGGTCVRQFQDSHFGAFVGGPLLVVFDLDLAFVSPKDRHLKSF